jgi:hypothetical protein
MKLSRLPLAAAVGSFAIALFSATAVAAPTKLQYVYSGNAGTVVFVHGHGDQSTSSNVASYWTDDGWVMLDEATSKQNADGSWSYYEAFVVGYDGNTQGMWYAANDVAYCLRDLINGTNNTGCNPSLYRRTSFRLVGHSEGGAILDRIMSTGWFPDVTAAVVRNPISLQGALAGSKAASALYGVDGTSNFCTSLVSWLAGWALKDPGSASLTRGSVLGEANASKAGKSPRWILKVTTSGGAGSCNNNAYDSVSSFVNDTALGTLCGCIGYSSSDDSDGVLWQYDTDPTSNPSGSNGGKYRAQYTGYYWHWVASWANHDHGRNDAYARKYGIQSKDGCYTIAPGTCIGQYGF